MDVVEALNKRHYMKMKYYLTKADEIDSPTDLMKVTSQVTQNLAHRVSNNHGFEVPSIFLPNGDASEDMAKFNNIGKLCAEIDRTFFSIKSNANHTTHFNHTYIQVRSNRKYKSI